jgi:hypothetical protein
MSNDQSTGPTTGPGAPDAAPSPNTVEGALIVTYRSLRLGIVMAVGMIFLAVIWEVGRSGYLRGSISSYFYSPVRSVFVGALMVIGFSLIVIHTKHRWEETCLTIGGTLAIIVGLVPTTVPSCEDGEVTDGTVFCRSTDADPALPDWVRDSVANNLFALVVISLIAIILTARYRTERPNDPRPERLKYLLIGYAAALVVGAILYGTWEWFAEQTHMIAAILTFVFVGTTAAFNGSAKHRPLNPEPYRKIYGGVAKGMLGVGVLGIIAIALGVPSGLFWLETVELAIFAGYWVAQTRQNWHRESL